MAFADRRVIHYFNVGASIADNTDLLSFILPAGKEIEIYNMKSYTRTKSPTASAKIELCDSASNILTSVAITQNNGTIAAAAQTLPVIFRNTSASDDIIKLRTDQATGTGCDVTVEVHFSYPGSK